MSDALINLRVPAATKGRWVRASRAAGQRLSDYIVAAVENYMQQQLTRLQIPDGIRFADLKLARDPDGAVSFEWSVVERVCRENGLPIEIMQDIPQDNVSGLLAAWYRAERADGGPADKTMDDLLEEVSAEDAAGQNVSHEPGRA